METAMYGRARHALRRAASEAAQAPSVHNTQPWSMTVSENTLEIFADRTRRLTALDPTGRQLMISIGCAVLNARVGLAAAGYSAIVERLPDPSLLSLVARLTLGREGPDASIAALEAVVHTRHANRRRFSEDSPSEEEVDLLIAAATREGAFLVPVSTPEHRLALAVLSQRADREQNASPAYRAEIRRWTTDDPFRRDGVRGESVPSVGADSTDDVPIRDFDARGTGRLPEQTHSSSQACLLLLCAADDSALAWLRTGEALQRVQLEITAAGYVSSPLTQVVELIDTREQLREQLGLGAHPMILLRVGHAPRTPATMRRRTSDVVRDLVPPPLDSLR